MKKMANLSLGFMAFLQALGLMAYCSLVAVLFWQGNRWFGKVPGYLAPLLFLTLFTTSALVCATITLGYPVILFWQKKQTSQAVKLVLATTLWLVFFTLSVMALLLMTR
jgi:hypothetical protein